MLKLRSMGFVVIETLNNLPYIFNWKSIIGSEAKTSWKLAVIGQKGTLFGEETVEKFSHFLEVCYETVLKV